MSEHKVLACVVDYIFFLGFEHNLPNIHMVQFHVPLANLRCTA